MPPIIHDIAIGAYVPGNSLLHRLDPRTKLVGTLLLLVALFANSTPVVVLMHGVVVILLAALTGTGWRIWVWGVGRFRWMLAIVAGTGLLFHQGGHMLVVWGYELPVSSDALVTSIAFTTQVAEAIVLSLVLTLTTTATALTRGLQRLFRPLQTFGLPVDDLALVLLLAMRFIPLLQQETRTLIEAQRSRGIDFRHGTLIARSRNLGALFVPALLGTLRRADILAEAMTSRGFRPGRPRSEYRPLQFSSADCWAAAAILLLVCGELFLWLRA
jgi:energy-coupling factor transport system permease protein